jgi:hypothetical protein
MQIKPNATVVCARVVRVDRADDGVGSNIAFVVLRNDSPKPEEDFLRPKPGDALTAFMLVPDAALRPGAQVGLQLGQMGGPFGPGRVVIRGVGDCAA